MAGEAEASTGPEALWNDNPSQPELVLSCAAQTIQRIDPDDEIESKEEAFQETGIPEGVDQKRSSVCAGQRPFSTA